MALIFNNQTRINKEIMIKQISNVSYKSSQVVSGVLMVRRCYVPKWSSVAHDVVYDRVQLGDEG